MRKRYPILASLQKELVLTKLELWSGVRNYRSTGDDDYSDEDELIREEEEKVDMRLWDIFNKEDILRKVIAYLQNERPTKLQVGLWLDEHQEEIDNCPIVLH